MYDSRSGHYLHLATASCLYLGHLNKGFCGNFWEKTNEIGIYNIVISARDLGYCVDAQKDIFMML